MSPFWFMNQKIQSLPGSRCTPAVSAFWGSAAALIGHENGENLQWAQDRFIWYLSSTYHCDIHPMKLCQTTSQDTLYMIACSSKINQYTRIIRYLFVTNPGICMLCCLPRHSRKKYCSVNQVFHLNFLLWIFLHSSLNEVYGEKWRQQTQHIWLPIQTSQN